MLATLSGRAVEIVDRAQVRPMELGVTCCHSRSTICRGQFDRLAGTDRCGSRSRRADRRPRSSPTGSRRSNAFALIAKYLLY